MRFLASISIGMCLLSGAAQAQTAAPAYWQGTRTAGHVAVYGPSSGNPIIDSGSPLGTAAAKGASDNTKATLSSVSGATIINDCPKFTDTLGTIADSGAPCGGGGGGGDVTGPGSAVSGHIATFNGTTGKVIQDGGAAIGQAASKAVSDNTKATVASVSGAVTSGNCAQFTDTAGTLGQAAAPCGSGGGGSGTSKNFITDFGGVPDWVYVAGSSSGTGTDNTTALHNALTSCAQGGATDLYIPPGNYYIAGQTIFGTCDTTVWGPGTIVCSLTVQPCMWWKPTFGTQQSLAGLIDGWSNSNSNGFAVTVGGASCEVGDILTLPGYTAIPRNRRERALFSVATCSGGAVVTLNVLQAGIYTSNPGSISGTMITVSGTTTGVSTTNLTWTAPYRTNNSSTPRTELVLSGPNALSDGNQCITLTSDSSTLCVGDKIKIISNQYTAWEYSNSISGTQAVQDTGNPAYGPVVAAGGTGYTAGDVLTIKQLTSPVTKGVLDGMPVQRLTPTAAQVTVGTVTATGAIKTASITTVGSYDHISYEALSTTGGTGTGAKFYLTWKNNGAGVGFSEIAAINRIVDATHIVMDRRLYYPHVFDAVNPPIIAKLPNQHLTMRDLTFRSSYNIHNPSFTGRANGLLTVAGAVEPVITNIKVDGVGGYFIDEMSTYHGTYEFAMRDGVDCPPCNGFNYGFFSEAASIGANVQVTANGQRHVVSSGSNGFDYTDRATHFANIGGSFEVNVHDSVVHNSKISCFDTHEDTFNWSFVNDTCDYSTADPNDEVVNALERGVSIRGYGGYLANFHSYGNQVCVEDQSQRFPYAGIFGRGSVTTILGADCKLADGDGYIDAIQVSGPAFEAVPPWGAMDPLAVTIIENGNYSFCNRIVSAQEEVSKVIIKDVQGFDCKTIVRTIGPTDLTITNNTIDDQDPSFFPTTSSLVLRSVSTHFVGNANIVFSNNTVLPSSNPDGTGALNPSTIFTTTETNPSYATNFYLANDIEAINNVASTVVSSGAPVNLIDPVAVPQVGAMLRKKTQIGVNLNLAGDTAIALPPQLTRFRVVGVEITNAPSSLTTATAALWSGPGGTGTNIAADQSLSALTGSTTQNMGMTLTTASFTSDLTSPTIYFRVGTPQGSAVTGDVYVLYEDKGN